MAFTNVKSYSLSKEKEQILYRESGRAPEVVPWFSWENALYFGIIDTDVKWFDGSKTNSVINNG